MSLAERMSTEPSDKALGCIMKLTLSGEVPPLGQPTVFPGMTENGCWGVFSVMPSRFSAVS